MTQGGGQCIGLIQRKWGAQYKITLKKVNPSVSMLRMQASTRCAFVATGGCARFSNMMETRLLPRLKEQAGFRLPAMREWLLYGLLSLVEV
jgi:hypothetical protein